MIDTYRQKEISVPTGKIYLIREQTGFDDEVLSQVTSISDADVLNRFMANIVLKDLTNDKDVVYEDILKMPLRDKYTLLIQSRIFSLGEELKFEYDWGENVPTQIYSEDLTQYVLEDYSNVDVDKLPYFKSRILPYSKEVIDGVIFDLGQNKFKFNLLDGIGENFILKIPNGTQHINHELIARNLSMKNSKGDWEKVLNFSGFSAKDMAIIRAYVKKYDDRIDVLTKIEHPFTGATLEIPLIGIRDFFFPTLL